MIYTTYENGYVWGIFIILLIRVFISIFHWGDPLGIDLGCEPLAIRGSSY